MTKLYKQKEIEIVNPSPKNFEETNEKCFLL
jgi:hypothetical protein